MMTTMLAAAALTSSTITAPGPQGPLEGTLIAAGKGAPVVVIIPGSGPTDRDGNNPIGITAQPYRLLAEALAAEGVSSVRIDKRGMFGSKVAIRNPNKVTIVEYASDAHAWAKVARKATGAKCVWLAGHSEGSLVALAAGQNPADLCGIISISGAGRPFGTVLGEQLKAQLGANPATSPMLDPALKAIAELEEGRTVDAATVPEPLRPLFNPQVQAYEIDLMKYRPAALAAALKLPLLIIQGDQDSQTSVADAKMLAAAQAKARLVIAPGVNHVLKTVRAGDAAANRASYADPSVPIAPAVVEAIASFVKR